MKKVFGILLATVLAVSLVLVPAVVSADPAYDSSLTLENKDPNTWTIIPDTTQGTLEYLSSAALFWYSFSATGLEASTAYSLIYYADYEDRYANWGGDNPGALIATFSTGTGGNIGTTAGSVDLGMDLPCPPDANISYHDYSGDPDYYDHPHGAKIWLVPSDCYDADAKQVITWSPTRFLFETDLIYYDDTDAGVSLTATVPDVVAISVNPNSIDFGTLLPGQTSAAFDITVDNIGTQEVDVSAAVGSGGLFYDNLQLKNVTDGGSWWPWSNWTNGIITDLAMGGSELLRTRLPVPADYIPTGTETATLIFTATASP